MTWVLQRVSHLINRVTIPHPTSTSQPCLAYHGACTRPRGVRVQGALTPGVGALGSRPPNDPPPCPVFRGHDLQRRITTWRRGGEKVNGPFPTLGLGTGDAEMRTYCGVLLCFPAPLRWTPCPPGDGFTGFSRPAARHWGEGRPGEEGEMRSRDVNGWSREARPMNAARDGSRGWDWRAGRTVEAGGQWDQEGEAVCGGGAQLTYKP